MPESSSASGASSAASADAAARAGSATITRSASSAPSASATRKPLPARSILSTLAPKRTAPAKREPIGERRAQAQAVGVARVDAAEQRLEDDVDHLFSETLLEKVADRNVASLGASAGPRRLAQRAQLAAHRHEGRAQER